MRRKFLSSLLLFVLIFSAVAGFGASKNVSAADTTVAFTFSNEGELTLTQIPVKVTDVDNDGKLTLNDVFIIVHTEKCAAAASGYATGTGDYGLYVTKFWGVDNVLFGYYVNNNMAMGPTDEVKDGDNIVAWIYKADNYSDQYTYFDLNKTNAVAGTAFTLTLTALTGYDPTTYAPVFAPLADATITVNGTATEVKTDADGKAVITLKDAGTAVISATSQTLIVPPVCTVTVAPAAPNTGLSSSVIVVLLLAVVSLLGAVVALNKKLSK